jgi:(2Fe-2S) ferredoxin
MKKEKLNSQKEIFICNFKREGEECCFDKGAKELTDELKKWVKENQKGKVKVFRSGCLGKCSDGIAIALYPEKDLLLNVNSLDKNEIIQFLER